MKILTKIVVGWKIGKGNKASQRGDHDRAFTFYRSAIGKASGSGYAAGEILARLALVTELEETGAPGELSVPELERLVALSRTTDRVPMLGRTARIRMEALEALVGCAVESGDRSVEGERRAALAEAAEELGERGPWIDALRGLGTFWAADDAPRSAACFERALEVCALVADKAREAEVLGAWSVAAMEQGDHDRAGELAERSMELQRRTGIRAAVGTSFARFDDSARRAVVRAKESAAEVSAPAIQVEHLLHALLQDDVGPCPAVFQALGADQAELIAAAAADRGRGDAPSPAPLPFSDATRAVLRRADRMAEQFESVLISTAHMLLALLDVIEGKSPQLLAARGIGLAELRKAVEQCSATRAD
ncbi:Clp protease N-terminal domain-containing protein [Actinomadura sp. NPDC000600]|uniref:Clp protease N-terminal domain-containing protein n=1 Tax=Actinomadura sp. NPDC000600 TaxID=3154262 RepID=UPI0033972154